MKKSNKDSIHPSILTYYRKLGLKVFPLSFNHKSAINWRNFYYDWYYWSNDDEFKELLKNSKIENVASVAGGILRYSQRNDLRYLNVLVVDSQYAFDKLTAPLSKYLSNPILKSILDTSPIRKSLRTSKNDFSSLTLLDLLKKCTFVTKAIQPYEYHIWWLSHLQYKSIMTRDCKADRIIEIKTDTRDGICLLPPSNHWKHKDLRYSAVGRTDEILIEDRLYYFFTELFNDCLKTKEEKVKGRERHITRGKRFYSYKDGKVIIKFETAESLLWENKYNNQLMFREGDSVTQRINLDEYQP